MKRYAKSLPCAALLSLSALSMPALAQSAGNNVFSVGWFHYQPRDSSEPLTRTSAPFAGPVPGSGAGIENADALGLALTHFWTDNFALTFDFGIPPTLHLNAEGATLTSAGVSEIGSAKQWSPALVAKWFFGDANSKFRPFVGAGVTYVWYSDVKLTQPFQNAAALAAANGSASAHLSSSWAPVANIGATYNFNKNWSTSLSVSYIPLKTNADITASGGAAGPQTARTRLTIDPVVTFLSVGYTF